MRHLGRLAAAAVGVAILAGACSDRVGYDPAPIESYLQSSQAAAFPGLKVGGATCPADATLVEGMRLDCTLQVTDQRVPYEVTLSNVRAAEMTIVATRKAAVITTLQLRTYLLTNLPPETKLGTTADCGDAGVVVAAPGSTISCTLAAGSQTATVTLDVLDDQGTVRIHS